MSRILSILSLVLIAAIAACAMSQEERDAERARECARKAAEGRARVDQGAVLLDVRPLATFTQSHLQDAVNIPLEELESRMADELETDLGIVIYDEDGRKAERAAVILRRAG